MSGDTKKSCPCQNGAEAIAWAAENNLDVVLPDNNQLLLDIDNDYDRGVFEQNRDIIDTFYGILSTSEGPSRSGKSGKRHIIVTLRTPVSPLERIALQAILGSDRRREAHSIRRLAQSDPNVTLFFEKRK